MKAFAYDTERVECLFPLLVHYCCEKMDNIAYNYYLNVKDFFENRYLNTNMSKKLFINPDKYNFFVPYYMILIADKVKDFKCVVRMFEIIFIKKQPMFEEWYIKNLLYNLQFFLKHVPKDNLQFIPLANDYIHFLFVNGVKVHTFECLTKDEYRNCGINVDKYTKDVTKIQQFSKSECACSKNILIYTGFSDIEWNYTYMLKNALGGSEKAVAYVSKCFPKDYNIFISGQVKNETIDNIQYIHQDQLTNIIDSTPFHTVIVSRYIGLYEMYQTCSFYQSFIWAHDTSLLPYGCNLNDNHILKKWNHYINGCVCLTEWHKTLFSDKYPELNDKITLINNGIDLESFPKNAKIKNKFIYTSRPERGLDVLLKLWPHIIEKIPDATLVVSAYGSIPSNLEIAMKTSSIIYLGKLNVERLYNEMSTSEFWLYPTHWPETSCITALEMLMSEVICLYYPVAGLVNTLGDYGIQVNTGSEIETIVSLTEFKKCELRKNGREYAETCSWENRSEKWLSVLKLNKQKWYFYCALNFDIRMVEQYIDNLNHIYPDYCIYVTKNKNTILTEFPSKITFVYEIFDTSIFKQLPTTSFSFLNTEPLNHLYRLQNIKNIPTDLGYYDYSESNLHILTENKIDFKYKTYLPYVCSPSELLQLQQINKNTEKVFDFGILKSSSGESSPRRQKVVNFLKSHHFSVNIIEGWDHDRDNELAKCKLVLNIHGNWNDVASMIFEHIRCNRLLESGFTILSETCFHLSVDFINKYPKLKLLNYDEFFNINTYKNVEWLTLENMDKLSLSNNNKIKNICFIHSCYLKDKKLKRLHYLIDKIKNTGLINHLEAIYINNIGIPIKENTYGNKINICNYSDNPKLYEIPTINKIHQFSKENTNCNILYLHTKGISYDDNEQKENDWIDMMLYFLVKKFELCLEKLQEGFQAVGCNYEQNINPSHFSGNFWWSESQYISKLPSLIEKTENVNPNDAEFWLCKNNPSIYVLHNSKINHYHNEYPKENYCKNDLVIQYKSELVINKLSNKPKDTEKIKIIDCFLFYNELDMLTYRLSILNDVVDYFVLVESSHTFIGKEKPLFYQENKHLFENFNHKIIHIIVDDFPHKHPDIDFMKQEQWNNEIFQRNCISRGINKLNLNEYDVITVTDLDEIPNPKLFEKIKANEVVIDINTIELDFYYYNLNCKMDHYWHLSKMMSYKKYKELGFTIEQIRQNMSFEIINNGGWHLSYFGDTNFIKNKIEHFSHQELNLASFTNEEKIQNRIKNKQDLFDRNIKICHVDIEDNPNLPPSYEIYLIKYYKNNYKITQKWFLGSEIKNSLYTFLDKSKENKILEIGCFEGLSSAFFADNFLDNPKSSLTCVDPFLNIHNNDHSQFLQNNEEMNFDFNISICENSDRITKHKITSDKFFENNNQTYNFIYIDGCHEPDFIKRDMENSFTILDNNGIMWMDDYRGGDGIQIKNTMDKFLENYNGKYELIHIGYQLALRKY